MSNTPHLRFPGFTGEWKEKKLGEVTIWDKFFQGVPKQLQSKVIKYPYVLANVFSDIERKEGTVLLLSTGNYVGWTTEELAGSNLCEGEVVAIPWGGTANVKYAKGKFVTADNRIATSSDVSILNNKFLYYFLLSNKDIIDGFYRGAGIKHPSMFDVLNMPIVLPSLPEQQKIASCLSEIDNLIAAQDQKVGALKEKKKGLMQQLFPQQGETTPRLRFPGFEGEWDYVNGNELFESISNKNHNSDLPILALTQDQGAVPRDMINYNVVVSDKSVAGYKVVEVDDFIISLRSFQGGIEYSRYKGLCSPAYIVLRKKSKELCSDFYRIYFKSFNYIQELNKNLEGIRDGKMISYGQFSEIKLPKPSLSEQSKIAECLSALDDTIKSESDKLDALKDHKKGLMQQLFPQPSK